MPLIEQRVSLYLARRKGVDLKKRSFEDRITDTMADWERVANQEVLFQLEGLFPFIEAGLKYGLDNLRRDTGKGGIGCFGPREKEFICDAITMIPSPVWERLARKGYVFELMEGETEKVKSLGDFTTCIPDSFWERLGVDRHLFATGEYVRKNPPNFVPKDKMIRNILFFGEKDFDGLRTKFGSKILKLSREPSIEYPHSYNSFNANKFLSLAKFLENEMEGIKRRTGEPSVAHLFREAYRGASIISAINHLWRNGAWNLPFTPDMIEAALVVFMMHDFCEDQTEDGRTLGNVYSDDDVNSKDDPALLFKGKKNVFRFPMSRFYIPYVLSHLRNLKKKDGQSDREVLEDLMGRYSPENRKLTLFERTQQAMDFIGVLAKALDKEDNFHTVTFELSKVNGRYISRPTDKIIDKAISNIRVLPSIEKFLMNRFATNAYPEISDFLTRQRLLISDFPRPSHWAAMTLLGTDIDDIMWVTPDGVPIFY